jgi:hypothetical protein
MLSAALACALLTPGTRGAAQATAEPDGYREAVDGAVEEYSERHFAEARALFAQAHKLSPNARTLRGLGMTEFELRNYPASVSYLEHALASQAKPLEGTLRDETERLLARADAFVGRYPLELQPADARLLVDGGAPLVDSAGALLLAVGRHRVEANAPGRSPERRDLNVNGGERETLQLHLPLQTALAPAAPATPPAAPGLPRDTQPDEGGSVFESPWFWVALSAVVVGAGVGVGIAALSGGETREQKAYGGDVDMVLTGP